MKKGINIKNLTREEWLAERQKGIGGSDAAAVAGLNPWKSAAAVYFEKIGEARAETVTSERLRVGHDLEDYVAKRFAEATGKKIRRNNYMLHQDEHSFILGDIDREIVGENAILECKTTNSYALKDWKDEPPLHYQIQCMHYMLVTGAEVCYIACLIGNEAFVWYPVYRDAETMQALEQIEVNFWDNNVLAGICPAPDGTTAYDDYLAARYPKDDGLQMTLSKESADALDRYLELKELTDDLEKQMKELQQTVKAEMGECTTAFGGANKVTWKTQSRTSIDSKALKAGDPDIYNQYARTTESRVFRITKGA